MNAARPRGFSPAPVALVIYAGLHLGSLGVFWAGHVRTGLAVAAVTFLVRMFALSAVYHRYFAHRAYHTSRPFQFVLAVLGTLTMQRGPLWWAATHRTHHQHSDTPDDLHSPHHRHFLYAHSGWFLDRPNRGTDLRKVPDLARYPELRVLDDWRGHLIPVALYGFALYAWFGWSGFVWGFCVSTLGVLHVTHWIQSMSHRWGGYRRFATADHSRNHWLLGVISLGEYHNNHHHCPSAARQGCAWWEVDVTHLVLLALAAVGLIWDLRKVTPPPAAPRTPTGEGVVG